MKKHKIIQSLLLFFIMSTFLQAQAGIITGKVSMEDGTELPGALVSIVYTHKNTLTSSDGTYKLTGIKPGKVTVRISLNNFNEERISAIAVAGQTIVINITLKLKKIAAETTVTADRPLLSTSNETSKIILTPSQIETLPSLGEKDIFRALQLLPGVVGSNEASSGLYVRGGTPDQNLVIYDGFTIYHVDHLFGYFSAFNMEAVKEVKLSKGGFEAKYGGRLSSVLELNGKAGNPEKLTLGVGISMLSINAIAEIPLFGKGSILIAGRRSFQSPLYNSIADMFGNNTGRGGQRAAGGGPGFGGRGAMFESEPSSYFYDLNIASSFELSKKDTIKLSFYNGKDDLDNSRELSTPSFMEERGFTMEGEITDLTEWGNTGFSFNWTRNWSNSFKSQITLADSNYFNNRDRTSQINITADPEIELPEFMKGRTFAGGSAEDNDLSDISIRWDNELLLLTNHKIGFGIQVTKNNIKYSFGVDEEEEEEEEDDPPEPGRRFIGILDREDIGTHYSYYLQDRWTVWSKFIITPGIRITQFDLTEKVYYEPRFSFRLNLTEQFAVKGAWGKHHQFASRITREDILQGNREFWALSNDDTIQTSEAIHYITGISYETDSFLFDVEAYLKDLSGLTEFATRFTPVSGDIDYNEYFYSGTGKAQGIEFLLQKKAGKYTGWMSYTLSKVEYEFPDLEDDPFPASHDQTHEFKLVTSYEMNDYWTLAGTWVCATGRPYTEPIDVEEIEIFPGRTTGRVITGQKNGGLLPAYHRLDLSLTYKFSFGDTDTSSLGLTVFNVYNRKNVWYKEFDVIEGEIIENNFNLRGLTFNIFFSIKF